MNLDEVANQLKEVDRKISIAVEAVESDAASSAPLQAVVKEFARKSGEALADLDDANVPLREHIVELEQAGDSAVRGADAEDSINDSTRRAILDAHAEISGLKAQTEV